MNHNDINPHLFILTSIYKLQNIFVRFLGNTEKIYNSSVTIMKNMLYYWPFFDYATLDIVSTISSI